MTWEIKPALLNWARLMAMSPDAVYAELKEYGAYQDADEMHFSYRYDENLEKALLSRNNALINLGLAEFGGVKEVAVNIWQRATVEGENAQYRKAVRLALLRNPHHLTGIFSSPFGIVPMEDLQKIVDSGERDEVNAILTNRKGKSLLADFLNMKPPFNQLETKKFFEMIYMALKSPCLTDNDDNEHGPDMQSWDIQKGILKLLETFPVSEGALLAFHWLLSSINPDHVAFPDNDPRAMFKRWRDLKVSAEFTNNYSERAGRYTPMDFQDEFICLLASLYGSHKGQDGKYASLGSLDDPDPVMRYCHYGRTTMKAEDMEKAWQKDEEAFVFAVLHGYSVSTDQQRAVLESHLRGTHQIRLYYRRIKNARKRSRITTPVRAVTEQGQELLQSLLRVLVHAG